MGTAYEIAFWGVYVTWIIMEIVVNVRARRLRGTARSISTHQDRGSVWVIYIGMYVVILIAFGLAVNGLGLVPYAWLADLGILITIVGLVIRYQAITQLGRYFSTVVRVHADQKLLQTGWYRRIRHPAYTGGWLIAVGLGLAMGSWWSMLVCGIGLWGIYAYRIRVEERALTDHFGDLYRSYHQHTWRMFPDIW